MQRWVYTISNVLKTVYVREGADVGMGVWVRDCPFESVHRSYLRAFKPSEALAWPVYIDMHACGSARWLPRVYPRSKHTSEQ